MKSITDLNFVHVKYFMYCNILGVSVGGRVSAVTFSTGTGGTLAGEENCIFYTNRIRTGYK